jgi:hypothetical protein
MTNTVEALISLCPNAEWSINHTDSGDVIDWADDKISQPTDTAIKAEIKKLQTAYDNNAYQRSRATEYPPIAEQLDDIYHNGIDAWKLTIKTIKDKYPKE